MNEIPIIKITGNQKDCIEVINSLKKYGILIIKDNRINETDNNNFINMMENYYENCDFLTDVRKEYNYQVGVTPELMELPRNHCDKINLLDSDNKPMTLCPPELDIKNRFLWRIGERPKVTRFADLNSEQVIPNNFPNWESTMNTWGEKMLDITKDIVDMIEMGLNLEYTTLGKLLNRGPHLLAPTGSNFNKYNKLNTVLAGYHYDISLLTIHGKSRFPGLYIWLHNGKKVLVQIPDGCLLVQAGKTLEYLTGGYIKAGFHEVIICEETIDVINKKKQNNESLWRVSSTLFTHIASDVILEPLKQFQNNETNEIYKPIYSGLFIKEELKKIKLSNE